jgi:hypothetical protein
MVERFEALVGLLAEEVELHKRLLSLVHAECRPPFRRDPAELDDLARRRQVLITEIRRIEHARRGVLGLIEGASGPGSGVTAGDAPVGGSGEGRARLCR